MADKKRLIDANVLIRLCKIFQKEEKPSEECCTAIDLVVELLNTAPTVDAVEVVRCKDCGKWDAKTGSCDEFTSHRLPTGGRIAFLTRESDFCSYGERRTDG